MFMRMRTKCRGAFKHCLALRHLIARLGVWRFARMLWLFHRGLVRIFTVLEFGRFVSGAGNKGQGIPALAAVGDRKGLLVAVRQEFTRRRETTYVHIESRALFFGATANNEREFYFLSAQAGHVGLEYSRALNLSFAEKQQCLESQEDATCKLILFGMVKGFSRRLTCHSVSADAVLTYCRYFYRFFRFFLQESKRLPLIAVVANDHSASTVAFSMVMKLFSVPRIYLQHAEVSPRFPALDFEYSILRNNHSAQVYKHIGHSRGQVYVVGRHRPTAEFTRLFATVDGRVTVVVYLTAVFLPGPLLAVVEALAQNPDVLNVQVKLHPRTSPELREAISSVQLVMQTPESEHIAIVGNSSVTIELLAAGIKVFQLFSLDDVGVDYYGFAAKGLAPEVSFSDLESTFWRQPFYTQAWRSTMADYDPALSPSDDDLQSFLRDLVAYLGAVQ